MTELHWNMLTAVRYANLNSEDKKTPVGALITRGHRHVAFGTNKTVLPVDDFWSADKYERMVHAEVDVITNLLRLQQPVEALKGLQLWVTLEPCVDCSKFILFTRKYTNIDKVYVWVKRPASSGVHLLREAGIVVEFVEGSLPDE